MCDRKSMRFREVDARSIFVQSALPDAEYVANPYIGCRFGCRYCYASFMGRTVGERRSEWGAYVVAKRNAVSLARETLQRWRRRAFAPSLLLSSVTDPYQGIERRLRLTRGILEALVDDGYGGMVGVLTKSPLVMRDLDLLIRLKRCEVGLTVTTDDERRARWLESRAPSTKSRLRALAAVAQAGVPTYAFIGPLLPEYVNDPERLRPLASAIATTGTNEVYVEALNTARRIAAQLADAAPGDEVPLAHARPPTVEQGRAIKRLLREYGLSLRHDAILHHSSGAEHSDEGRML